ncbi:hypothetical protein F511_45163 [Dorcoceras hygrometricum]|uniref:Uncharacterized protein n=1 Tax=Dorcoceras hygrometricum TaxID=472368 RepID=A0A2Z7A3Z6_9LAMI|nr:hypothetical protein F511_45163 [Dorcoceras hygrometricum]
MADAPTYLDQLSLVSPWFGPWLVSLEPHGPWGGPVGRAPALVAREWRTNVKTSRWSRRRSMAKASICSDQFSLVSQRFEPSGLVRTIWTWGWSIRKGFGSGGRSREKERKNQRLVVVTAA